MPLIVSSIPTDPSLTVLKLSIKQHKGEKKYHVLCSFHGPVTNLGAPTPAPGARGAREAPVHYVYWNE